MRVGYVQTATIFGRREENFEAVRQLVCGSRGGQAFDLLVLPELFATGYTFTSREEAVELAEPVNGPTAAFLREVAREWGGVVVAGFAELADRRVYNSSLVVNADGVIGTYRKIHLFNREKLWFEPGDRVPAVFEAGGLRIGVMICFDWIFPETMRMLMLGGADIVAHPANLVLPYCQDAMRTRCLENRMFAVTANRVGREARGEDDFLFTGMSQITAHNGTVLASAPEEGEAFQVVDIDPAAAHEKHLNPYNDIVLDRRTELYARLCDPGREG